MSGDSPATRPRRDWLDIMAVFVLSITAVLTAWCGFEASKWGGEMSIAFSQASSARVQATSAEGEARDARQFDLSVYAEWVRATYNGEEDLAAYIEDRFSPEFAVAFEAWRQLLASHRAVRARPLPHRNVPTRPRTVGPQVPPDRRDSAGSGRSRHPHDLPDPDLTVSESRIRLRSVPAPTHRRTPAAHPAPWQGPPCRGSHRRRSRRRLSRSRPPNGRR